VKRQKHSGVPPPGGLILLTLAITNGVFRSSFTGCVAEVYMYATRASYFTNPRGRERFLF